MRSLKFTYLLIILASFVFISCENEPLKGTFTDEIGVDNEGDGDSNTGVSEPFFAKVDGDEFIETTLEAYVFNNKLFIRAYDANNSAFIIGLPEDVTESSFDFNGADYTATYEDSSSSPSVFTIADSGNVTVVTHNVTDKVIEGVFSFVSTPGSSTTPQYVISEGEFSVSYQ